MKPWRRMLAVAYLALGLAVVAGEPDDDYVRLYRQLQQADELLESGRADEARREFLAARDALVQLRTNYPNWNPQVVEFRLRSVSQKLGALPIQEGVPLMAVQPPSELELLRQRVRALEMDRDVLQAKLREAVAAQPAALDPRELTKAEERIKAQQKEIDVLRAQRKKDEASPVALVKREDFDGARQALAQARSELVAQRETDLSTRTLALSREPAVSRQDTAVRETENRRLRTELGEAQRQLGVARAAPVPSTSPAPDVERLRTIEQERDELRLKLDGVVRKLLEGQRLAGAADLERLTNQLVALQSRVEVLEARRAPFSTEELAWFKSPVLSATRTNGRTNEGTPMSTRSRAASLVASMSTRSVLLEEGVTPGSAARSGSTHVAGLVQRAMELIAQRQFPAAERTLRRALVDAPRDALCLSLLGQVRFRQGEFEEALAALSQSAQLDPEDSETFTYLGLVLSRKGLREPAEAALWRAVQLAPRNETAHYNLAVIYVAQEPPLIELARFHYQKALAAGFPADSDFEKRLAALMPSGR